MTKGNSEAIDKALAEYNRNIGIVAESRDNGIWRNDHNIVGITELRIYLAIPVKFSLNIGFLL